MLAGFLYDEVDWTSPSTVPGMWIAGKTAFLPSGLANADHFLFNVGRVLGAVEG